MFSLLLILAVDLGPIAPEAPGREPQLAANSSLVALTFGAGNAVYFSASHDVGRTFSAPVKVGQAGVLPLNRHRGPRIAVSKGTIVISAVTGRKLVEGPHAHGLPADGDLIAWRSSDGGKTWSKGVNINDVPAAPREGLHTLAADDSGNLFAAWLDQRASGTRLFGSYSSDRGATWSQNVPIHDGTVCECCHPSAAFLPGGGIAVMWRNWLDGARDLYLARSRDSRHFEKPEKLGQGTWLLNACPMDGGGLAVTGERVVTAWRREDGVFLAEPDMPETRIGTGKDVALAAGRDGVYAVWSHGARIEVWHAGKTSVLAEHGAFPAITSLPDGGVLAAWEENGAITWRRLP